MLDALQRQITNLLVPATKVAGEIAVPYCVKKISGKDYYEASGVIQPGDILLAETNGHLTTWLIPGFWTHAAIYCGKDPVTGHELVVEAVGAGVIKNDLVTFMLSKDAVAILRPTFTDIETRGKAVALALKQAGKPYDYEFDFQASDNKAFYCAELVYWAYKETVPSWAFELRSRFGQPTVTPQDFYDAKGYWRVVFESAR